MRGLLFALLLWGPICARAPGDDEPRALGSAADGPLAPGDHTFALTFEGVERRMIVHVPPGLTGPAPLVLALHGGGGNVDGAKQTFGFDRIADKEKFVLMFPEGVAKKRLGKRWATWNVGDCCKKPDGPDDAAFLVKAVDDLAARMPIDLKRVYATGISNGSVMSLTLACKHSDRLAAVAATGALLSEPCSPSRPVPTLYVAGQKDPCSHFDGGKCGGCWQRAMREMGLPVKDDPGWDCPAVPEALEEIAARSGCTKPVGKDIHDSGAWCRTWTECTNDGEVTLCVDPALGHSWPGGAEIPICVRKPQGKFCRAYRESVGPRSDNLDFSQMSWDFFKRFELPAEPR